MYPEYAEINGKKYKIDTDYKTALRCFEIIDDKTITDYERAMAIVYLLFDFIPEKDFDVFLEKATLFLGGTPSSKKNSNKKKDIDFKKDRSFIIASFLSDYHINITTEKLHFWLFIDLISGLKDDCILNKIRDIRNCNLADIKDKKMRDKVREAKIYFNIEENINKPTKEQIESAKKFNENLKL